MIRLVLLYYLGLLLFKSGLYILGVPLDPRGPQATRDPVSAQRSDWGRCNRVSAPNCETTCSHLTLSSRILLCPPTQLPAPSSSWRRCAGGSRRRRLSLERYNRSKGKWRDTSHYYCYLFSSSVQFFNRIYLTWSTGEEAGTIFPLYETVTLFVL